MWESDTNLSISTFLVDSIINVLTIYKKFISLMSQKLFSLFQYHHQLYKPSFFLHFHSSIFTLFQSRCQSRMGNRDLRSKRGIISQKMIEQIGNTLSNTISWKGLFRIPCCQPSFCLLVKQLKTSGSAQALDICMHIQTNKLSAFNLNKTVWNEKLSRISIYSRNFMIYGENR